MATRKDDPMLPWVVLNNIPNLATAMIPQLVEHFGSAQAACDAPAKELEKCAFLTPTARKHILDKRGEQESAQHEIDLAKQAGVMLMNSESKQYPGQLRRIPDPPPLLYVKGDPAGSADPAVAIVGTRKCTGYGRDMARELAQGLVRSGINVISGLAHGIDSAAHQGAMHAGGRTAAVLGSGLNVIYPAANRRLADEIVETGGALISEFPMDCEPEKWNFPRRNRIVSGLSRAVVVIEAPEKSGALITAACAMEQGRDVMAVPGNVKNRLNKGPHQLIRDGACLVESVDDILDALQFAPQQTTLDLGPRLTPQEDVLYNVISGEPVDLDTLCRRSNCPVSEVLTVLTLLEMKGMIRQLPGKLFVRPG